MTFDETKQAVALAIDENFVCHAEEQSMEPPVNPGGFMLENLQLAD